MGKLELKNRKGETVKTEHKYSKGPLYFMHGGENNSVFTVAAEIYRDSDPLRSLWMRYYNDVIHNDFCIHEDKSKDLYEIIRNIENETEKNRFFKTLIDMEYDPYIEIPDTGNPYIEKIQRYIKANYGYAQLVEASGKKILTMYDKKDDRFLAKIYLNYIDAVILQRYSHTSIITNEDSSELYERLLQMEDYWKRSGNGVIHTNGKKTGLDFRSQKLLERIF